MMRQKLYLCRDQKPDRQDGRNDGQKQPEEEAQHSRVLLTEKNADRQGREKKIGFLVGSIVILAQADNLRNEEVFQEEQMKMQKSQKSRRQDIELIQRNLDIK